LAIREVPVVQLPEQVIEAMRQLLDDGESYQWATGDFIIEVLDEFPSLDRSDVIKQLADRTGRDRSTLRDRHNMCKFYPPDTRKEYDALTYSQLRACKAAGDRWREYADWALDNMPAPVAVIRARVRNNGHDLPAWVHRWEIILGIAKVIEADRDAPEIVRQVCGNVVKIGDHLSSGMEASASAKVSNGPENKSQEPYP